MTQTPKISVIVPVYQVENYLHRCLDSIVKQTYRNLEIILVDDGSPDNCGAICDEYAEKDDRIIVIHQENAGVSAARNAALDIATGDFIGFVDSDDWVELDMYEYLLTHAAAEGAEIVVCGKIEEYARRSVVHSPSPKTLLNREQAMEVLVNDRLTHSSIWDKLWKRELFEKVRFPVNRVYEDYAVAHLLFGSACKVILLPEAKYHYRQCGGGVMDDRRLDKRFDWLTAVQERCAYLEMHFPQLKERAEQQFLEKSVPVWCAYYSNSAEIRKKAQPRLREIAAFAKPRCRAAVQHSSHGLAGRMVIWLIPYAAWWSFALAGTISWVYRLRHGRFL